MSELKFIYTYVLQHSIDSAEYADFTEYMKEEGIKVYRGLPDANLTQGVLLITDVADYVCEGIVVAGYGADYKGTAKYVLEDLDVWVSYLKMIYARGVGQPWKVAETERLVIREMALEDLPDMYKLYDSIKDCPYIEPLYEWQEEYEFSKSYIENMYTFFGYGLWLVYEACSGELVGRVGIENRTIDGVMCQELGYLIRKDKQGMGYAVESLEAVIELAGKELCLEKLFICTHMDNEPSIGIAKKLGFDVYATNIEGMNLYRRML